MDKDHPLRSWRRQHGKTLAALAAETKIAASHLSFIETGARVPSLEMAARLCVHTGLTFQEFVPSTGQVMA